jgi:RHS repeat-associated protein
VRSGSVPTDILFTRQRLDDTGLYFYNARYYDPTIGRFISADTIIPNPANPQAFNRYSYVLNNPLKYIDPTGYFGETLGEPPTANGSLGYTEREGWLISVNGEWYPVESNSVDILTEGYKEQIKYDEVSNWSDFIDDYIPDMPGYHDTLGYGWGGNSISLGDRDYLWLSDLFGDYDKKTGSRIPRLVLDERTPDYLRKYSADALRGGADVTETLSPGITEIPAAFITAAATLYFTGSLVTSGGAAVLVFALVVWGPDIMRDIADWLEPDYWPY